MKAEVVVGEQNSARQQEAAGSAELRPEIPHPARMYDYYLGGKDNFPADREAAERALAANPEFRSTARANRGFLQRAVRHVAQQGVDQFLDIGTGIPTAGNTHEIAQQVDPRARVVYVDNDPIVLTHARALMAGMGRGRTDVLQADLRDPAGILAAAQVRELLDFDRPVALVLAAVLHFLPEDEKPYRIVEELLTALAPGSYLVLSHGTADFIPPEVRDRVTGVYTKATAPLVGRSRAEVRRFFDGLELLEPEVVTVPLWRPEAEPARGADRVSMYGGVARKH
ncbi:SAM-dependent methyltransferase [Kitasatospora herbaricolor]|uniref:SAM-dependent methyltransferase n=1 Tax=Kitasatospora herbaricolor TaxID=68217 RepID=UPI001748EDF3|nr:SAM-dependent methyltransferase [Kitasatospora herbaricolor]MDQ0311611.1 SAM-dependent methyltransferase [Kitasatospora herbaricolor]